MTRAEALAVLRRFVMETCGHPTENVHATGERGRICLDCWREGTPGGLRRDRARHARAVEALAVLEK